MRTPRENFSGHGDLHEQVKIAFRLAELPDLHLRINLTIAGPDPAPEAIASASGLRPVLELEALLLGNSDATVDKPNFSLGRRVRY